MAGVKKVTVELLNELLNDIRDGRVRVFSSRVSDDGKTEQVEVVYVRVGDPKHPRRPCSHVSDPLDVSDADSGDGHSLMCQECGATWDEPE